MNKLNNRDLDITSSILPVIPTMDVVVFPRMVVPLLVLDERIIAGINKTLEESKLVLLLASSNESLTDHSCVSTEDLYRNGTIASVMRLIKIPDGGIKILVQGLCKAEVIEMSTDDDILYSSFRPILNDESNSE